MSQLLQEVDASALPETALQLWHKALLATKIHNDDYAVLLLSNLLKTYPGFVECRRLLRRTQISMASPLKKPHSNKGKGVLLLMKVRSKKKPQQTLERIEGLLSKDPFSITLNEGLFQCAVSLGLTETAEFALETIHTYNPTHTSTLHKLAEHYSSCAKYSEAARVYQSIIHHKPHDTKAVRKEKDCIAKASMTQNQSIGSTQETIDKET